MIKLKYRHGQLTVALKLASRRQVVNSLNRLLPFLVILGLVVVSIASFIYYYHNGLGLAYNDARSHLNISRRVVENIKPGIAQLGSVWLPLPHILMIPTVWHDFMWHSGLAGSLGSMAAYVLTGWLIYLYLKEIGAGLVARLVGVAVFAFNLNIMYLQSTAMTETLLLFTMTAAVFELLIWIKTNRTLPFLKMAFWLMLSTLVRYDGWFLLIFSAFLITVTILRRHGFRNLQVLEGKLLLFFTLSGLGIGLWLLWNLLIFKDPLYFIFGPYSAYAQQTVLEGSGVLATKGNLWLSIKFYLVALVYNSGMLPSVLGLFGGLLFFFGRRKGNKLGLAALALMAPLFFNILALYLGHSVLFIQGLSGNTWFNIRYGIMMAPSIAIFIGYLIDRLPGIRPTVIGLLVMVYFFAIANSDAVTIDDATVGASQKNVTRISAWLNRHAGQNSGLILISVASHDAVVFSSGLPMKRFIHEGTGKYWTNSLTNPHRYARWIVMNTQDPSDMTTRKMANNPHFKKYRLVGDYPFADVYQLKPKYLVGLTGP